MGTGQLLCLILGVLFLAAGAGMLGGRYALDRYGDASLERPPGTAESVGTPAAKPLFPVKPPLTSTPAEFELEGEQELNAEPTRVAEPDGGARNETGDDRETASPPETLPGQGSSTAPREAAGKTQSKFVIQAMSTSSSPDARAARGSIMTAGFPAGVFEAELPGRGKWYRVYIGPYDSEEEARPALEAVRRIPGFEGSFMKAMD
jgi:cell division septation protein DedD